MNERMLELYVEACEFAYKICKDQGRQGGTGDHIWNTLSTGKFAELIVQECALCAGLMEHEGRRNIGAAILDKFGVLE